MLSNKAKYALKALAYLAGSNRTAAVHGDDIAEAVNVPRRFLGAILLQLKNAGYVSARRGFGGGYGLQLSPSEIAVGEVVRLIDGPVAPLPCASRNAFQPCDDCGDVNRCLIRGLMIEVRDAIARLLDEKTIADISQDLSRCEK
jgi:Rrf2 family protein